MRLSDARLRRRTTNLIYPDHRNPHWPTEDAPRDRSNRLLDASLNSTDTLQTLIRTPPSSNGVNLRLGYWASHPNSDTNRDGQRCGNQISDPIVGTEPGAQKKTYADDKGEHAYYASGNIEQLNRSGIKSVRGQAAPP